MLDKLMCYSETHACYQAGLEYGELALALDRAHERTHQRMVRLLYLSGDRAGAIRQYHRCVRSLAEELNVKPAVRTLQLYDQVRADSLDGPLRRVSLAPNGSLSELPGKPARSPLQEILNRLRDLEEVLADVNLHLQQNIHAVERMLHGEGQSILSQKGETD
jgi:DNA-binding SARP family transcriptional activator